MKIKFTLDDRGFACWPDIMLEAGSDEFFDPKCKQRGGARLSHLLGLLGIKLDKGKEITLEINQVNNGGIDMKIIKCSVCGKPTPSTLIGADGRCPDCLE